MLLPPGNDNESHIEVTSSSNEQSGPANQTLVEDADVSDECTSREPPCYRGVFFNKITGRFGTMIGSDDEDDEDNDDDIKDTDDDHIKDIDTSDTEVDEDDHDVTGYEGTGTEDIEGNKEAIKHSTVVKVEKPEFAAELEYYFEVAHMLRDMLKNAYNDEFYMIHEMFEQMPVNIFAVQLMRHDGYFCSLIRRRHLKPGASLRYVLHYGSFFNTTGNVSAGASAGSEVENAERSVWGKHCWIERDMDRVRAWWRSSSLDK